TVAYDDNGWLPAATHGWYSTMQEYAGIDRKGIYEYGCAAGYRVNVQLRPGERLSRPWSNRGLHVNQRDGGAPGCLTEKVGEGGLRYAPKHGDLAPGRVGNGVHEWRVPLATKALARVALTCDGLANAGGGVGLADAKQPGVLVLRMPSSYVFLAGAATIDAVLPAGGSIAVELSDNNGLAWKPVATVDASGERVLALDDLIFRRYDYRLRLTFSGKGTTLKALTLRHDVQHSQRALPALAKGDNAVSFTSGDEGTITVMGSPHDNGGRNVRFADFNPTLTGIAMERLQPEGGSGTLTVPIATPGDLKRLRIGAHYRARDERDGYDVSASFDDAKTWVKIGRLAGPIAGNSVTLTCAEVPKGTRAALVRLDGQQRNTSCIFDLRIDADYVEPAHGFTPLKVTYIWEEDGVEKRDEHVASKPSDTWTIRCAAAPVMKDLIVEQAP
ncbi:MAG: hypothetical protein H0X45_04835, partial [Planctomycetes bacterium]|nr:hypothetical protein [Planctomycetota bacterium]